MPIRPRVLIADDHTLMAELCQRLLASKFDVVGIVTDGQALVRAAHQLQPEVILLDIAMPGLNGLDAGQQIKDEMPKVKLVYLTMTNDAEVAAEAFRRGASAYLLKTCSSAEIVLAVKSALGGTSYVSRSLDRDKLEYLRRQGESTLNASSRLTQRQREVLQLLAEGKAMKEVGDALHMTTRTVAFHKYRVMEILGARSNAELVRFAVRNHMVSA
jgi:DNA-binding NarL/FixJ family response regulator